MMTGGQTVAIIGMLIHAICGSFAVNEGAWCFVYWYTCGFIFCATFFIVG